MAASVGSLASATMRAEPAVSASGTGLRPSSISLRRHWPSACVWLRTRLMVFSVAPGVRHQLVAHAQEVLADDVEIGVGQQVMDVGDAAGDRVLDRDHGEARFARLHRLQRVLERRAGDRFQVGERLAAGEVRIGARLALIDDARRGRLVLVAVMWARRSLPSVEAELLEAVLCPYRGPAASRYALPLSPP